MDDFLNRIIARPAVSVTGRHREDRPPVYPNIHEERSNRAVHRASLFQPGQWASRSPSKAEESTELDVPCAPSARQHPGFSVSRPIPVDSFEERSSRSRQRRDGVASSPSSHDAAGPSHVLACTSPEIADAADDLRRTNAHEIPIKPIRTWNRGWPVAIANGMLRVAADTAAAISLPPHHVGRRCARPRRRRGMSARTPRTCRRRRGTRCRSI